MFENVIEWMRTHRYHEACYKLRGMQGRLYNGVCHGAVEPAPSPGLLPDVCMDCPHWRLGGGTEHQSPQRAAPATPSMVCPDKPDDLPAADVAKVVYGKPRTETRKVRLSVFLEQWPEAPLADDGVLDVCPTAVSAKHRGKHGGCAIIDRSCNECRREFWMQEAK